MFLAKRMVTLGGNLQFSSHSEGSEYSKQADASKLMMRPLIANVTKEPLIVYDAKNSCEQVYRYFFDKRSAARLSTTYNQQPNHIFILYIIQGFMGVLKAFSPLLAPPRGSERYLSFSRKPMTSPLGGNEGALLCPGLMGVSLSGYCLADNNNCFY